MKRTTVGIAIAALTFGIAACGSSSSTPVAVSTTTTAMPADATDQAGVACVAALGPKVGEQTPQIRNHTTRTVDDTFITAGQVSKYIGGEAPHNYQFECTTRYNGTFTSEVTYFKELARTPVSAPAAPATTTATKPSGCRETPAEYLATINASFLDGYSFGETKAIQKGELWYIGGQIHNAEGGIRSRDDLFVAKDMIITPVTTTARNQSTLPDLRKVLNVSFTDPAATAALDCARTY